MILSNLAFALLLIFGISVALAGWLGGIFTGWAGVGDPATARRLSRLIWIGLGLAAIALIALAT